MKTTPTVMGLMAILAGSFSAAYAATGGREDNSGIFVWVFLGFCALIVVAQLIPALLLMFGLVKGVSKERELAKEPAPE